MIQIMLVLNDKELSTILQSKLVQKYKAEVIVKTSASEAISFLEILPTIQIIICSETIKHEHTGIKLHKYHVDREETSEMVNLLILGDGVFEGNNVLSASADTSSQDIVDYVGFLLKKTNVNNLALNEAQKIEKLAKEKAAKEKAENDRLAAIKLKKENEILAKLEKERLAIEIFEKEKKEKEEKKKILEERIARGQARLEAIEKEKLEKIKQEEEKRIAEIAELKRRELLKIEEEKAAIAKAAQEARDREKANLQKIAQQKIADEKAAEEKRQQELIDQAKFEAERIEKKKAMEERIARGEARLAALEIEKIESEKNKKEKIEKVIFEYEKLEKEKLAEARKIKEALQLETKVSVKAEVKAKAEVKEEVEEEPEEDSSKTTVFKLQDILKPAEPAVAPAAEEKIIKLEYFPKHILYFVNLADVIIEFTVYSRIKKGDSFEYHKKINGGTKISQAEIDRILLRSGKELFIESQEVQKAQVFLNGKFLSPFKNPDLSMNDRMKLNSDCFEILLDLFKSSAFNKSNIEIIKEIIKSIDLLAHAPDALNIFLSGHNLKKLSYGYAHSFLAFYFLLKLADYFSWGKEQSKNKLLYLSLFHDLSLHSDRLIKLHHNYVNESKNLTEEEKEIMFTHAESTALVLESIVKAPKEMTSLIKEHHGLKSGKGFVEGLSLAIAPTSMAFIVIEDFVTLYLKTIEKMEGDKAAGPTKPQLELIFSELKVKFDRLVYADVLAQLQKVMGF
jgi:hypothetical protein